MIMQCMFLNPDKQLKVELGTRPNLVLFLTSPFASPFNGLLASGRSTWMELFLLSGGVWFLFFLVFQ